jgi:hypothetical protein
MWRAARSLWSLAVANSVADFSRYEVIWAGNVIGSPGGPRCHASNVAAPGSDFSA